MTRVDIRPVLRAAQPPLGALAPALALGALAAGSSVALLATSAWLIARAAEQPPILFLGFAIVGVRAFAIGRAVLRYLERVAGHDAALRALAGLRVSVFRRLVPVAPDGLRATRSGDVLTTVVQDVDALQDLPLRVVQPLVSAAIVAGLAVVGVAWVSPQAALVLAIGLAVTAAAATAVLAALSRDAERRISPLRADLADAVLEYVSRWETLRAFGADGERREALLALDARLRRAQSRQSAAAGAVAALVTLGGGAMLIATLLAVQPELASGALSGPELAMLVLLPLAVIEVVGALPSAVGAWWRVRTSAERIATVVPEHVPAEIPLAPEHPRALPPIGQPGASSLRLAGVAAHWPGDARPALAPLDLELHPGDRVVLEGPSGAGKTTLAHVLVRFLEHEGRYELGGVDVRELHPDEVRRRVVLLEQHPHLFDESIRQNLIFARDTASEDELLAVLERVGLGEWAVERGGLDAPVGERGRLVSGGQAQRIALARALLCDAPVLVLDEPTANVDADRSEALLEELLGAAAGPERAVLVISHAPVPDRLVTRRVRIRPAR
ncbi:hypothetical protein GCM10009792_17180 [Microcella alkalica]|uniref:ATP-binding cassette subfamily C protein CydC n=1 Tax=Microcella alkalica TaxID=355930 RepID=A0A839EBF1_9MICO|nr:thiol reductant ABC exporter subunit CydC [Microcella alkalica]MBA8847574.1 ATP-binding cassette subfamily C protein CydC [Microcella alkalica]